MALVKPDTNSLMFCDECRIELADRQFSMAGRLYHLCCWCLVAFKRLAA